MRVFGICSEHDSGAVICNILSMPNSRTGILQKGCGSVTQDPQDYLRYFLCKQWRNCITYLMILLRTCTLEEVVVGKCL